MNNIGLIISGNLTGFSHFYDTPTAKELYAQAKFDFDYRNNITFLNAGEKLYSVSFAPKVLAISLVTRILDSFRRPGILVVSILIPRQKKIESVLTGQSDRAVYDLLNAVNDKFYERNFINGMLNQNIAVLMQDYYSEILANYRLVDDKVQRNVCATVDPTLVNKRCGYVKATETDMASYLAAPCRKSYEGYNDVHFAGNAPQNIEEPPVELVLYSVYITNNGQRISAVRLTDRVFNLHPSEGELDIDKNYTYQQVLNGDAGTEIIATQSGEQVEITYRFREEKRTISFMFSDGNNRIPFENIMPKMLKDGEELNIPSESYTFVGKEIYKRIRIESGNANFAIKNPELDITRIPDGGKCIIPVVEGNNIEIDFTGLNKSKEITLTNRKDGKEYSYKDVTDRFSVTIPGKREDYSYRITSDYYETVNGVLSKGEIKVYLRAKTQVGNPRDRQGSGGSTCGQGTYNTTYNPVVVASPGKPNGGRTIKLNPGNPQDNSAAKGKLKKIVSAIALVTIVLVCALGFVFKDKWFPSDADTENNLCEVTKTVSFIIQDNSTYDKDLTPDVWCKIKDILYVKCQIGEKEPVVNIDTLGNVIFTTEVICDSKSENLFKYWVVLRKDGEEKEIYGPDSCSFKDLKSGQTMYITLKQRFSELIKGKTPETDTPKTDTPKTEIPKTDTHKTDTPKTETPKEDTSLGALPLKDMIKEENGKQKAVKLRQKEYKGKKLIIVKAYNEKVRTMNDKQTNGPDFAKKIKNIGNWEKLAEFLDVQI